MCGSQVPRSTKLDTVIFNTKNAVCPLFTPVFIQRRFFEKSVKIFENLFLKTVTSDLFHFCCNQLVSLWGAFYVFYAAWWHFGRPFELWPRIFKLLWLRKSWCGIRPCWFLLQKIQQASVCPFCWLSAMYSALLDSLMTSTLRAVSRARYWI